MLESIIAEALDRGYLVQLTYNGHGSQPWACRLMIEAHRREADQFHAWDVVTCGAADPIEALDRAMLLIETERTPLRQAQATLSWGYDAEPPTGASLSEALGITKPFKRRF
jgi:hypothetical protein